MFDMSLFNIRQYSLKNDYKKSMNVTLESALKNTYNNINKTTLNSELFLNQCSCYENANNNVQACIRVLESIDKDNIDKISSIYTNNVLPYVEDIDTAKYYIETSSLDEDVKNNILEKVKDIKTCDRVYKNYTIISKDINLNNIFANNRTAFDTVLEVCIAIDDLLPLDTKSKCNIALESILYGSYINCTDYNTNELEELITEYFIYRYPEDRNDIQRVLECSKLKQSSMLEVVINEYASSDDVKSIIKKFKSSESKDKPVLKQLITRCYAKSPEQIIDEIPNFLAWIRLGIIASTASISILITLPLALIDCFIALHIKQKESQRMLDYFNKERAKAEKSKEKAKDKSKIDNYLKKLDECIYKLEEYRDKQFSEKENEERESVKESISSQSFYFLDDFIRESSIITRLNNIRNALPKYVSICIDECGSLDYLNESNIQEFITLEGIMEIPLAIVSKEDAYKYKSMISSLLGESYHVLGSSYKDNILLSVIPNVNLALNIQESNIVEESISYIDKKDMVEVISLSEAVEDIASKNIPKLQDTILSNIDKIDDEYIGLFIRDSKDILDTKSITNKLRDYCKESFDIKKITNMSKVIDIINSYELENIDLHSKLLIQSESISNLNQIFIEGVNLTTLKTASLNLQKKMQNLSTKEKEACRTMDINVNNMKANIEKALTTDKRENIIKGSIIPSFSRCIKFALAATGTYMISPTLAVIASIGALGVSKSLTIKERKLLVDEIDVELKVVEKQIEECDKSDANKYRKLLTYQRKLEREKMRIEYNLKASKQTLPKTEIIKKDNDDE